MKYRPTTRLTFPALAAELLHGNNNESGNRWALVFSNQQLYDPSKVNTSDNEQSWLPNRWMTIHNSAEQPQSRQDSDSLHCFHYMQMGLVQFRAISNPIQM
jgi:hypothetical protein